MSITFYWYPNCGTCKKARKWLNEKNTAYEAIHIVEDTPSKEKLLQWIKKSGLPAKKFFNTSGKKYRELNLKDKVKDMTDEKIAEILASDGMLIKRPIAVRNDKVTVGFKEELYEENWL